MFGSKCCSFDINRINKEMKGESTEEAVIGNDCPKLVCCYLSCDYPFETIYRC